MAASMLEHLHYSPQAQLDLVDRVLHNQVTKRLILVC